MCNDCFLLLLPLSEVCVGYRCLHLHLRGVQHYLALFTDCTGPSRSCLFWRYTDAASPLPLRLYGKLSESSLKALCNGISFIVSSTLAVVLPLSSSRLQHLVALLSPLQALDALLVHLLFHLGESLSFFFRGALGLDSLDSSLLNSQLSSVLSQSHGFLPVAQTPSLPSAPSPSP